jgi:cytochrome oxidase Cu insertion factor (SCO1/SenC/PrrC family)
MRSRFVTGTLFVAATVLVVGCLLHAAMAQPVREQSPRENVIVEFNRLAPLVGQPIGSVKVLDAEGRSFDLSGMHGQYTVVVFGCLT